MYEKKHIMVVLGKLHENLYHYQAIRYCKSKTIKNGEEKQLNSGRYIRKNRRGGRWQTRRLNFVGTKKIYRHI